MTTLWRTARSMVIAAMVGMTALSAPVVGAQNAPPVDTSGLEVQNATTVAPADGTPAASPEASPVVDAELRGYIVGDPDAPVTLQIYHDYQCPHCRNFYNTIEGQLVEEYVQTGQVKLELLDFTVVGVGSVDELPDDSKESVQAAEAAMCAAEQNAFLDYYHTLYTTENTPNSGDFSDENLIGFAEDLDLDTSRFRDCLENGTYEDAVIQYVLQGIERGVPGTPTFSINGGELFGTPEGGYEEFKEMIDAALEQ